jgi:hypothetical protein
MVPSRKPGDAAGVGLRMLQIGVGTRVLAEGWGERELIGDTVTIFVVANEQARVVDLPLVPRVN